MASRAELGTPVQVDALAQELARVLGPAAGLGSPEHAGSPFQTRMPPRGLALRWLAPCGAAAVVLALCWVGNTSRAPLSSNTLPVPSTPLASAGSAVPVVATRDAPVAGSAIATPAADPSEDGFTRDGTAPLAAGKRAAAPLPAATRGVAPHFRAAAANEAALLEKARALLSREPARALALTREHRRRFPRGTLAEEREVIAIEALELLGQKRAASDEADAFGTQYRNSVHRERLQRPPAR
jgi:hypothetical protein